MPFFGIMSVPTALFAMIFAVFFQIKNTSAVSSRPPKVMEMTPALAQAVSDSLTRIYGRELYNWPERARQKYNAAYAVLWAEHKKRVVATTPNPPGFLERGDRLIADTGREIRCAIESVVKGVVQIFCTVVGIGMTVLFFSLLGSGKKKEQTENAHSSHSGGTHTVTEKSDHGPANPFNFHPGDWRRGMSTGEALVASIPLVGWLFANLQSERKHAAHFLHNDIMKLEIDLNFSDSLKRNRDARDVATKAIREIAELVSSKGKDNFPMSQDHLAHISHQLGAMKGMLKMDLEEEENKDDGSKKIIKGLQNSIRRIEKFKKEILEPVFARRRQQDSVF